MLWKAVGEAFDQAWAEIASHFASDSVALCNAILSVASEDSRDVEVLKKAGLQPMARNYKLPIGSPKTRT